LLPTIFCLSRSRMFSARTRFLWRKSLRQRNLGWVLVYAFISDADIQEESEEIYTKLEVIKQLFKSPTLFCNLIIYSLLISIRAIFYTTAPFILIKDLGVSSQYLFVFIFIFGAFLGLKHKQCT
jgi:hypothetical protein